MKVVDWSTGEKIIRDATAAEIAQFSEPAPVPAQISFAQLVTALVAQGFITDAEGEAWLQGNALPGAVTDMIAGLPTEQRFAAKARMYRMSVAERGDDLVTALAQTQTPPLTDTQIDDFFRAASAI